MPANHRVYLSDRINFFSSGFSKSIAHALYIPIFTRDPEPVPSSKFDAAPVFQINGAFCQWTGLYNPGPDTQEKQEYNFHITAHIKFCQKKRPFKWANYFFSSNILRFSYKFDTEYFANFKKTVILCHQHSI